MQQPQWPKPKPESSIREEDIARAQVESSEDGTTAEVVLDGSLFKYNAELRLVSEPDVSMLSNDDAVEKERIARAAAKKFFEQNAA